MPLFKPFFFAVDHGFFPFFFPLDFFPRGRRVFIPSFLFFSLRPITWRNRAGYRVLRSRGGSFFFPPSSSHSRRTITISLPFFRNEKRVGTPLFFFSSTGSSIRRAWPRLFRFLHLNGGRKVRPSSFPPSLH